MMIYDISQEVFSCRVYPGDPAPEKTLLSSMEKGDMYNLTAFSMCAHNGTHIDAPSHFLKDGKTVDEIGLDAFVGMAYVAEHQGIVTGDDAAGILEKAKARDPEAAKRILIKGAAEVSSAAAKVFASAGILLLGNESQTVGPEDAPMEVHLILLGANVVLLEGVRLAEVPEGVYFLNAAPLNLSGAEGSPCRAVLTAVEGSIEARRITAGQGRRGMKTIVETILSGGSAEFSHQGENYLIQQESNKGCHYLSLWRLTPKAACLCRVCFEIFDGVSEETVRELFDQRLPDGRTVRDMIESRDVMPAMEEASI